MTQRGFGDYLALRARLAAAMSELEGALSALGAGDRARHLAEARQHLTSDAFRLMVVGEFKRGKSTLINALLGQDVLPAKLAPCTAVITEVKHGDRPQAVLHHSDLDRPPRRRRTTTPDASSRFAHRNRPEGEHLTDPGPARPSAGRSPSRRSAPATAR